MGEEKFYYIIGAVCGSARPLALLVVTLTPACGSGAGLFRQYEYEEEMYLSLDGTATVYVNSSVPALNALRGSTLRYEAGRGDREVSRRVILRRGRCACDPCHVLAPKRPRCICTFA